MKYVMYAALAMLIAGIVMDAEAANPLMVVEADEGSYVWSTFDKPCTVAEAVATIPERYVSKAYAAHGMYEFQLARVCVVDLSSFGMYAVHWDDGTMGLIQSNLWIPLDLDALPKPKPQNGNTI